MKIIKESLINSVDIPELDDFIWNSVMQKLTQLLQSSDKKFRYDSVSQKYTFIYNENNLRFSITTERNGYNRTVDFKVDDNLILTYKAIEYTFSNRASFKTVFENGSYKNYVLAEAWDGESRYSSLKSFPDSKLHKKAWKYLIDSGQYLKRDIKFLQIYLIHGLEKNLGNSLKYREIISLPDTIMKELQKDASFKAFLNGLSLEKLNAKLTTRAFHDIKKHQKLSVENVANFLQYAPVTHKAITYDKSGPWAISGKSQGVDKFNISKLQNMYPDVNTFILNNIKEIFKILQSTKYKHPLGYYTLEDAKISGQFLDIITTNKTYYN